MFDYQRLVHIKWRPIINVGVTSLTVSLPTRIVLQSEFNNFFTSVPAWMKQLSNAFLLPYSNGYRVVDPNIIIQEVSGSSVSGDGNLLESYNITPTPGGYILHVIGIEAGAHISVNRTVVKFVGYQNQL